MIEQILTRRSVFAANMQAPGPSEEQLQQILAAGHRVPDHCKIGPWRFVVFSGDARAQFGTELASIFSEENPDVAEKCITFEQNRLMRAPLVIAVVSSPKEHKVPEWEQVLCAGAVCQNVLLAATSLGFGAQWLTEWYTYNKKVDALLCLSEQEKIAGFLYIGSYAEKPKERTRPDLEERISYWQK